MPASFAQWAEHYGYDPNSEDAEVDYQRYLDELAALEPVSRDEAEAMLWWNRLTPADRRYWLDRAGSARPADAWQAYQQEAQA
ncbi:hypothetical protein [Thioalkalivibrio halophilus]|uniref:Uncharacterized protein n=1 Tax=Thioalkalivibrio halophilus TaxID=252474 RepID=A0A1V2ZUZ2_9GAMM|nr:hypothetical protein [Thioalkalivibrio halophilus]OOC08865.1 hypothetical protein B1A74_14010 [Thioalkalivibrio halophilus]